jgi:hypothetical protein
VDAGQGRPGARGLAGDPSELERALRVGPALSEGGHRRYSDVDIRRFRHMRRLIDRGMRPREAAITAFRTDSDPAPVSVAHSVRELSEAAEELRFAAAALLDEALASLGPAGPGPRWSSRFCGASKTDGSGATSASSPNGR